MLVDGSGGKDGAADGVHRVIHRVIPVVDGVNDGKLHELFLCSICREMAWDPQISSCNHILCMSCLERLLLRSAPSHQCPECRSPIKRSSYRSWPERDIMARRTMANIAIFCPLQIDADVNRAPSNRSRRDATIFTAIGGVVLHDLIRIVVDYDKTNGCTWTGPWANATDHLNICHNSKQRPTVAIVDIPNSVIIHTPAPMQRNDLGRTVAVLRSVPLLRRSDPAMNDHDLSMNDITVPPPGYAACNCGMCCLAFVVVVSVLVVLILLLA